MFHLQNRLKSQNAARVGQTLPLAPKISESTQSLAETKSNAIPGRTHPIPGRTKTFPVSNRQNVPKEEVVKYNLKIIVYVLCQDDKSRQQAIDRFGKYSWARITLLKSEWQEKGLYENCAQLRWLPEVEDEWSSCDFVGTISYKAPQKIDLTKLINALETSSLNNQSMDHSDVIFFFCAKMTLETSARQHPNFMRIWNDILVKECKISSKEVAFCNFWIAKPVCMKHQIAFFKNRLWPLLQVHPLAQTDAKQKSTHSKDSIAKCNGNPWYSHVPFILERVPRNFFKEYGYIHTCL